MAVVSGIGVGDDQVAMAEHDGAAAPRWPPGGGEMGRLIRAQDWSRTALGPVETWPQNLRLAVEIMLSSRYPMLIWWGGALVQLYNDAYVPVMGKRHPGGLGGPAPEIWPEAWPTVGPLAEAVMRDGVSTWNERLQIVMTRNGYPEEVYMTFSYSPISGGEGGGVGGLFCTCTEETPRVLGERRLRTLGELAEANARAQSAARLRGARRSAKGAFSRRGCRRTIPRPGPG